MRPEPIAIRKTASPDVPDSLMKREDKNPDKVMPLLDHIRELRNLILISMAGFLAGAVLSFIFSNRIVSLFTRQFASVTSAVESNLSSRPSLKVSPPR